MAGDIEFVQPQQIDIANCIGVFVDGQRLRVLTPGHIGTGEAGTLRQLLAWGERDVARLVRPCRRHAESEKSMKTIHDIETSQHREQQSRIRRPLVAQVRREIAAGEYMAHEDAAIDNLIASGDLAMESTPRTEAVCCVCHSPLNGIACQTASGWACYFCGAEDRRQSLDDPDDRVEHAERWDGMS